MTPDEQDKFAEFMREHIPKPQGAKWHSLYFITEAAQRALARPVLHWRDLSREDARTVMRAAARLKPQPQAA